MPLPAPGGDVAGICGGRTIICRMVFQLIRIYMSSGTAGSVCCLSAADVVRIVVEQAVPILQSLSNMAIYIIRVQQIRQQSTVYVRFLSSQSASLIIHAFCLLRNTGHLLDGGCYVAGKVILAGHAVYVAIRVLFHRLDHSSQIVIIVCSIMEIRRDAC